MPRTLEIPQCEMSTIQFDDDILESLFAYPPLALEQLFDDPTVQKRIGELISLAANRPRRRRRHRRSF
jgi:hypothetical protein